MVNSAAADIKFHPVFTVLVHLLLTLCQPDLSVKFPIKAICIALSSAKEKSMFLREKGKANFPTGTRITSILTRRFSKISRRFRENG